MRAAPTRRLRKDRSDYQVSVSDHALVRWLERVQDIDVSAYRASIADIVRNAMEEGATSIQVDGFLYLFDPHTSTVITVLTPEQRKKRSHGNASRHWMIAKGDALHETI